MNKATKLDPQMYDAYLGEGVYQYYAGTLPSVVKVLAKLLISGNADKGIEYLNLVKDKGRFSSDTAKLLLVEISIESQKYHNPALAEKYIKEIIVKYPSNPLYRFVGIIASYENRRYDDVIVQGREFLSKIGKERFYNDIYISRAHTAIGSAYMAKGDYETAARIFEESIAATAGQQMSRWQLWNQLRLAQSFDALGRSDEALVLYRDIKSRKENWGMDDVAAKYIKTPFIAGSDLGRMSPP
jgi:tetratricopeptide (TPR) repeat protein